VPLEVTHYPSTDSTIVNSSVGSTRSAASGSS
jgi:hypothetical protein